MKKKFLYIFSIVLVLILSVPQFTFAAPQTVSGAVILIDADSGRVLYEKNADAKMFPASTTKVMSAILFIENIAPTDIVTASYNAVMDIPIGASNMGIMQGEQLTAEQLFHGVLVYSANEACNVLAEHMSGSVDAFVEQMNAKAKELGMDSTHFVNPHGLHDENHYTTARDMAKVARYAMQNETFRKIVNTLTYYIEPTNKYEERRILSNTNYLINGASRYAYSAATGIKTGYTSAAANCLISSATKGDENLIAVTLGAKQQVDGVYSFIDSKAILEYGFESFSQKTLSAKDEILAEVDVKHGRGADFVTAMAEKELKALLPTDVTVSEITSELKTQEGLVAPIAKGTIVGTATYYYKDEPLGSVNLVAGTDIKTDYVSLIFSKILAFFLHPLVLIPILLIVGGFIFLVILAQIKAKKRRRYLRRKRYRSAEERKNRKQ